MDCKTVLDWASFHSEFARVFGFPAFYGKNMDAWIDCMTSLDVPDDGMSTVHCEPGRIMTIELQNAKGFALRYPEQYEALVSCAAFVNKRRIEVGDRPIIALEFKS
jgi:RNAse (barnase) inhibitor barstar